MVRELSMPHQFSPSLEEGIRGSSFIIFTLSLLRERVRLRALISYLSLCILVGNDEESRTRQTVSRLINLRIKRKKRPELSSGLSRFYLQLQQSYRLRVGFIAV